MKGVWWWLIGLLTLLSVVMRHNLLFMMSLLLALVGGASWLWAHYCLAEVSYQRRFGATRLFFGDETTLDIEITNAKPLPLPWLRAQDDCPEGIEISSALLARSGRPQRRTLTNLLSLRWYERVTRHYHLRAVQRGSFQFGPAEVSAEDIFGFAARSMTVTETQTVLVYPKIVTLTTLSIPAQHPFGDFKTRLRVMDDPLRLMGARSYVAGDNMRDIHWKATARRTSLQTKVFDASASLPLAIFLNVNTFEHVWQGIDHTLQELAITTAASIARYGWDNGHPIGIYANSVTHPGGERIRISPSAHTAQLIAILEALARVVEYGRFPLDAVMHVESAGLPFGATAVIVTALVSDGLKAAMHDLRQRGHAIVLVTVGDAQPPDPLPNIVHYHAGGREVWHDLESLQLA